jgi:hypothetical protein
MGFSLRNLILSAPVDVEPEFVYVTREPTKAMSLLYEARVGTFNLPAALDQRAAACLEFYRDWFTDEPGDREYQIIDWVLNLVDDTLVGGIKDPEQWVLPRELQGSHMVRQDLRRGVPLTEILGKLLSAARVYLWMYLDSPLSRELVPRLLDLEQALATIKDVAPKPKPSPRVRAVRADDDSE